MRLRLSTLLIALSLLVVLPGCYRALDGHSKAGMPFKKDEITGRYERPASDAAAAAHKVLEYNGTLVSDDVISGVMIARVDTRTVYVKVQEIEPEVSQVQVQARKKNGGADIDLASQIQTQIALNLK